MKLINKRFPKSSKFHKIFNHNSVKVSYSCTDNMAKTIKSHNKNISSKPPTETKPCNCRDKTNCPMNGKCCSANVIYKCTVSTPNKENKVYIGLTEGEWKKRYYSHKQSFEKEKYSKSTALSNYIWDLKKNQESPSISWSILKSVPAYSNMTKRCLLCLHEKFEIINYTNQKELLNKRSELISKCRHENKYMLANYKSKD